MNKKKIPSLKDLRVEKDLSQSRLAVLSGVHQSRISLFEREEGEPNFAERMRLSTALDVLVSEVAWPVLPEPVRVPELEQLEKLKRQMELEGK